MPNVCEIRPMIVFQSTTTDAQIHQTGVLLMRGVAYRPHVIRVVLQRDTLPVLVPRASGQSHVHAVYHLILVHSGLACFRYRQDLYDVPAGTLLCISPGEPHQTLVTLKPCRYSAITFDFTSLKDSSPLVVPLPAVLEAQFGVPVDRPPHWPLIPLGEHHDSLNERFGDVCSGAYQSGIHAALSLTRLLLDMTNLLFTPATSQTSPSCLRMEAVKSYLIEHYATPHDVSSLACGFNTSPRTLTREFKAVFAVSPIAFQLSLRISVAKQMLQSTNMQVQEIATEVGYRDLYQFSRAFRKQVGISPTAFRTNNASL